MRDLLNGLRDVTVLSIGIRMLLAVVCGGLIGIEREYKRRPAGFRTHILICLGAAMTTTTSQYICFVLHYSTDVARLGAQVIAGIGFIGAGTIIVTRNKRIKGLTTAAGLWVSAIIGLALGCGFYEGGLLATGLILLAELLFSRLEYRIMEHSPEVYIFMEYTDRACLENVLQLLKDLRLKVLNLEITRSAGSEQHNACAIFSLRLKRKQGTEIILNDISRIEGVVSVEEL